MKQSDKGILNKPGGFISLKDLYFLGNYLSYMLFFLFILNERFIGAMGVRTIFLITFFFVFTGFFVCAQEPPRKVRTYNHFLEIGLGFNYHAIRDEATSPLIYRGNQPSFHLQYFFSNRKILGIIDENFSVGYLKNRNYSSKDKNRALSFNNDLLFSVLYNFRNREKSTVYIGGELLTMTNIRQNDKFNNANINYEVGFSLAPSAMFEYRTSWQAGKLNLGLFSLKKRDRNFKMQYALSLPVFSAIARPGYVTINDFVDESSMVVDSENINYVTFDHLFLMKNRFNFYYILHNNNMLKFNYNFTYYNYYKNLNPVKGFHSAFYVSVVFRFTNN